MITFRMNGLEVKVEEGSTLLDAAKFYGLEIPTLCYYEGLAPYGGCRMCVVEIGQGDALEAFDAIVPRVKALLSRNGGVCPEDGAPLRFDPWNADRHVCSRCGRVASGERHHRHRSGEHQHQHPRGVGAALGVHVGEIKSEVRRGGPLKHLFEYLRSKHHPNICLTLPTPMAIIRQRKGCILHKLLEGCTGWYTERRQS